MMYELHPVDGRKSFYGKAVVEVAADGTETLYSYGVPVIRKTAAGALERLWGGWSATTGRHIAAFCGIGKSAFMTLEHNLTPYEQAQAYAGTLYR